MNAKQSTLAGLTASLAAFIALSAAAHHSDSLYFIDDRSADGGAVRIEGTISRVRWINPHVEFFVQVTDGDASAEWAIETDSVNQLRALGWTEQTIEAGDRVVVVVSKSKFDDTAGRLRDMVVHTAKADEPTAVYVEYKSDGSPQWEAPLELYRTYTPCPGTVPYDAARQPGKETLLCVLLDAEELAAARQAFGARLLLLR